MQAVAMKMLKRLHLLTRDVSSFVDARNIALEDVQPTWLFIKRQPSCVDICWPDEPLVGPLPTVAIGRLAPGAHLATETT